MQDCWSFTCGLSRTLDSSSKCSQLKSFLARCSSEVAQLVPLPDSWWNSNHYSDRSYPFSVTIPRYYQDVYVNSFFPRTAGLLDSLSIECFPLIFDLSDFKSRINKHLLTVSSFQTHFLYALIFFVLLLLLVIPCFLLAFQSWKVNLN